MTLDIEQFEYCVLQYWAYCCNTAGNTAELNFVNWLATEPFLLLHREHGTLQATDGAETAAIDRLVSS